MSDNLKEELRRERMVATVHRKLPQDNDAERGLLGCVLMQPRLLDELTNQPPEVFHLPSHQRIFQALRDMRDHLRPIDLITLTSHLEKEEVLEDVGGASAVTDLFTFVPTAANWDFYLEILRDKFKARTLIAECTKLISSAYEAKGQEELDGLIEEAEMRFFALRDDRKLDLELKDSRTVMNEVVDAAEVAHNHRGRTIGIPTGFVDVVRMLGGLMKEELYLIAARPSQGKSAFMINMLRHQVLGDEKFNPVPVGLFSLEMPAADQGKRMVCDFSSLELQKFRDGFFAKEEMQKIGAAAKRFMGAKFFIDDTAALSVQQFRVKARRMVSKHGVRVIYIDYLQLMRSSSKRALENRQAEVAEISTLLKRTARELKIPIVALAQLTRDAENKKPNLSHLRESGQLEQDADGVIFVYRPQKGEKDEHGNTIEVEDAEAIIAKQRNGPIGDIPLRFIGKHTRFESTTKKAYSNNHSERQKKK